VEDQVKHQEITTLENIKHLIRFIKVFCVMINYIIQEFMLVHMKRFLIEKKVYN
jgi:hypothetical protein